MNKRQKLKWGASLKPGDIVNDCRFKDLPIKIIKPIIGDHPTNKGKIIDYDIVLEDGASCSLRHCCNKPEEIPQEIKNRYKDK